jgi:hypothetical protein
LPLSWLVYYYQVYRSFLGRCWRRLLGRAI